MKKNILSRLIRLVFLFTPSYLFPATAELPHEKQIIVVIPSYNNITWYKRNLDSMINQAYTNWHAYYIDDCSTDGTAQAVERYIKENNADKKITLIKNSQRVGALHNIYTTISKCPDAAIMVMIDGDDWLPNNTVLSTVNGYYTDPNVWMTYGQYQIYPGGGIGAWREIPNYV